MTAVRKLLVLYTGGTIGMQASAAGLAPASGFEARLRAEQAAHPERPVPAWVFREMQPLLDSADMGQGNWLAMREAILAGVEDGCDGVLLLHGTDTLAYSAAALAFLLLDLPVPVLLTGSMLPAGAPGSDAWDNLFGALAELARGVAPGTYLYFAGRLLHGARASKLSSEAFDAFVEPPRKREGTRAYGVPAVLDYRQPRRPVDLAVLPFFPGIRAAQVDALVDTGARGLLLECYGSGTGPSGDDALLAALRRAHERGVVLAAISQCPHGHVEFGVYAAGSRLREAGLVSAGGMTREAAVGKLFALLGAGLDQAEAERWFALDLCGERVD